MRGGNPLSSGESTLGGMSVQEFETPEARRAEVDSGRQIQKDTCQQIVYFGWKYSGKKAR
jgi:hypothetical protein